MHLLDDSIAIKYGHDVRQVPISHISSDEHSLSEIVCYMGGILDASPLLWNWILSRKQSPIFLGVTPFISSCWPPPQPWPAPSSPAHRRSVHLTVRDGAWCTHCRRL
jgi:hypothetical protein